MEQEQKSERDFTAAVDEEIAQRVRRLREARGLTQAELVSKLAEFGVTGFYQTTIARIERGERPLRASEAMAIARVLHYEVQNLIRQPPAEDVSQALATIDGVSARLREYAEAYIRAQVALAAVSDASSGHLTEGQAMRVEDVLKRFPEDVVTSQVRTLSRRDELAVDGEAGPNSLKYARTFQRRYHRYSEYEMLPSTGFTYRQLSGRSDYEFESEVGPLFADMVQP